MEVYQNPNGQPVTLLKNNNALLPLNPRKPMMVGLIGPYADRLFCQDLLPSQGVTIRKGLKRFLRDTFIQLDYHPGCPLSGSDPQMLEEGLVEMQHCDVVIAVVGSPSGDPQLPEDQLLLLERLKANGETLIIVVLGPQPQDLAALEACSDAICRCPCPGANDGEILPKLLFGTAAFA